jgi:hypothetical protein
MYGVSGRSAGVAYGEFLPAGARAAGEFHCAGCGYGIAIRAALPACPMCGARTWERVERRLPAPAV